MRNGLNIAAARAFAEESSKAPAEAQARFAVAATRLGDELIEVETLPARTGSLRVVRDFRIRIDPKSRGRSGSIGAIAATAIGACLCEAFVLAASARDITVDGLGLELALSVSRDDLELEYSWDARCAAPDETIAALVRDAYARSPNHRTVMAPNEIRGAGVADPLRGPARGALRQTLAARVHVGWRSGTHLSSIASQGGVIEVDQPKQQLGQDRAPNPQEYLLAALAADLLDALGDDGPQRIAVSAALDRRCMFGLDNSAAGLRDIVVAPVAGARGHAIEPSQLRTALDSSPLAELICSSTRGEAAPGVELLDTSRGSTRARG